MQIEVNNRRNTSGSPRLRELLPVRAEPTAGESITMLRRSPHLPLPSQFVNTEVNAEQKNPSEDDKTEKNNLELEGHNEAFEETEWTNSALNVKSVERCC